jgi:hypothetical protein
MTVTAHPASPMELALPLLKEVRPGLPHPQDHDSVSMSTMVKPLYRCSRWGLVLHVLMHTSLSAVGTDSQSCKSTGWV